MQSKQQKRLRKERGNHNKKGTITKGSIRKISKLGRYVDNSMKTTNQSNNRCPRFDG